ncbi:MAG: hypothetical protein U0572_08140 [Phycisphaerales bacterium]
MRRTLVLALCLAAAMPCACASTEKKTESPDYCASVKPGTVTSANYYCVVMLNDPVDPTVTREWKGQKVGFCCQGCIKKWDAMTDAQKDAAVTAAVAKGKPPAK